MTNNNQKAIGFSMYNDDKGRTIYYDKVSKKAYLIDKKEESKFLFFSSRPATGFVVGYLAYYLTENWAIAIFAGVATYLTLLFFFRFMFLKDLIEVKNFVPGKKEPLALRLADRFDTSRIIVIIVLALVLSVGTIINAFISKYEGLTLYLNYALAIGAFIFACFYGYVLIVKKRNN